MNINNHPYRTIWLHPDNPHHVQIIDQRHLPYEFTIENLTTVAETATAIRDMHVRGAGLIGATAGFGMMLAAIESKTAPNFTESLLHHAETLLATRPTAVNLRWAIQRQQKALAHITDPDQAITIARETAQQIADDDANWCHRIGQHGLPLIQKIAEQKNTDEPVNILTHCNAGWLAFVDHGSATAPIYAAHDAGIKVHVWVDETRPRNQGARLTAWELGQHGVPHTVIADNTGGHLMQHGLVDLVITGTDRTTHTGDVANKIGTYLKALAAKDNNIPFYVALPSSTFDWEITDGIRDIPIEQRDPAEVTHLDGTDENGTLTEIRLTPESSPAANYAFDVTPARLITALITENGICPPTKEAIATLHPH